MDQLQAEWDTDAAEAGEGEEVEPPMPAAESPLAAARREVRAAFDRWALETLPCSAMVQGGL